MPGRYMHSTSASACEICAPGTFQGRSGQTHCVACEPGGYCEGGGARKTLCPAGTYNDVRGLSNASQCKSCTPGHSCSIGSVGRTKCRAGYFAATERAADCHECDAGLFISHRLVWQPTSHTIFVAMSCTITMLSTAALD